MSERASQRRTILLLGTGHWSNAGNDYKTIKFDDMLAPGQENQILDCFVVLIRQRATDRLLVVNIPSAVCPG